MKKKIIFGMAACLFAMVTMFSFNKSQKGNDNVWLRNITALSTTNAEFDYSVACNRYYHGPWCGAKYTQNGYDVYYSYAGYF
jgi:hypothetical protein